MAGGEAASKGVERRILDKAGLKDGKSALAMRSAQPPIRCPECDSERTWKDGLRWTSTGAIQRYLCRRCGFRFSDPAAKLQIEVDVSGKLFEMPNSGNNYVQRPTPGADLALEKLLDEASLFRGEDVGSQDSSSKTSAAEPLNVLRFYNSKRRVCAEENEAKNLAEVETRIQERPAGATTLSADIEGYFATYAAKQIIMGLKEKTIKNRLSSLRLLYKRGANLLNPESVFKVINHAKRYDHTTKQLTSKEWSEGTKNNAALAYIKFCEIHGIQILSDINFHKWTRLPQKLPWIPLEREIDQLIAGFSKKVACFLQFLKETYCRCGEAWKIKWIDVDSTHNVITLNNPEKNGLPRQVKVSSKLIAMINTLPKNSEHVFGNGLLQHFRKNFMIQRKRTATVLQNPRINRITFHTLRHWGATMEYHRTKDILYVKERLGHRNITSTLIYTHLVNFEGDEYHTATAKTIKEDEELLKTGFEYVTERDRVKIYRKRK